MEITDTTRFIEWKQRPEASKQELNLWQKLVKLLGLENDEAEDPGHIVFPQPELRSSDGEGGFRQQFRQVWGERPWIMSVVIGLGGLGCFAMLYALARFAVSIYRSSSNQVHVGVVNDEEDKYYETERLLDEENDGSDV